MKSKSQYLPSEKYRISIPNKHIEHKYLNRNYTNGNITDVKNDFYRNKDNIPYTNKENNLSQFKNEYEKSNIIFNLSQGKIIPSFNKENIFRKDYHSPIYTPIEKRKHQNNKNYTNIKLKPFNFNSKIIDENHKNNMEEKQYPSNYSYYEYKYTKKKLDNKNINKTIDNTFQFNSKFNTLINNEKKKISNTNSNHILIKNNNKLIEDKNINISKGIKINNKSLHKISDDGLYIKINKNRINTLVTSSSDNKKRNIILHNIYNISNMKHFDESNYTYNNTYTKNYIHQRTPLGNHTFQMNNSQEKKTMNNNYTRNDQTTNFKNNLPGKSYDNIEKLVYIHQNSQNKNSISYKKKLNMIKNYGKNINEPIKLTVEKTPDKTKEVKVNNFIKINNIIDKKEKYNNTITITINDTNEYKNIIKKFNFDSDIDIKPNIKEHIEKNTEILGLKQNKNMIKDEKKRKNNINGLKILDSKKLKDLSSPKNNIIKNMFYKNKINEIKNNNLINKKENNYKKLKINIENEESMKKSKKITYDNYTEPSNEFRRTFIQKNNYINNNNEKYGKRIIIKGRIVNKKDFNKLHNYESKTEIKKNKKSKKNENNYFLDGGDNKSIENIFRHKNNLKTDIISAYIINKFNNKTIINNNHRDYSNKSIKKINNKENDKNKTINKANINIFNSHSLNKINHQISNSYFNLSKLTINENKKDLKQKENKNLSKLPIHISRLDENTKNGKNIEKNDDRWDKIQFKDIRKKTFDARRRARNAIKTKNSKKNKNIDSFEEEFSSGIYVKASEGLSLAGKNSLGNKKINQDTYVIERNVNGILNFNIFGVLDGHGDDGHFVSNFVKKYVIHRIKNHPSIKRLDDPKEIYHQLKLKGFDIISKIFIDADAQIQKEKFDCIRSGTTIVLVIQLEEHIICANTGDSRAIAIYDKNNNDNLLYSKIFHLSYDCKPNLPNEKRRIYECGGVVEKAYYSNNQNYENLPFRVWVKGENYPGLAMSRSIGDMDAKAVGVIPDPQIVEYTLDYSSKYLLICSDGIWEFISNEEAMQISNKFYLRNDPMGLCHELSQSSIKLWEEREIVIDDITVLVVFF